MQSMHPKPPYLTLISIIDQFATVRWQRNNPLIKKKISYLSMKLLLQTHRLLIYDIDIKESQFHVQIFH